MEIFSDFLFTGFQILASLPDDRKEELTCIAKLLIRQKERKLSDDDLELMKKYDDLVAQIKDLP